MLWKKEVVAPRLFIKMLIDMFNIILEVSIDVYNVGSVY